VLELLELLELELKSVAWETATAGQKTVQKEITLSLSTLVSTPLLTTPTTWLSE